MTQFIYKSLFMYSSLQFCGHIEEYLAKHTEKLVVFVVMPRPKNQGNLLRLYRAGKLVEEKPVILSENIFLYYLTWYLHYLYIIFKYFHYNEKFIVLSGHPISFLGMSLQRLFRRITYAYWIGDYFPPVKIELILFEKLKKYYHDRIGINYYLSDTINKIMNGRIIKTRQKRTVMWGVENRHLSRENLNKQFNLLFVGLMKEGQGLEVILNFLKNHKDYSLKIIGVCPDTLFKKFQFIIQKNRIGSQVFFPNKFYSDEELRNIANTCHVGIALYDISSSNATYYTDPGKVKAYLELGIPVIMSDTSAIADYVKRFNCGEVIKPTEEIIENALISIKNNYVKYCHGIKRFLNYFSFERYYKKSFTALEYRN